MLKCFILRRIHIPITLWQWSMAMDISRLIGDFPIKTHSNLHCDIISPYFPHLIPHLTYDNIWFSNSARVPQGEFAFNALELRCGNSTPGEDFGQRWWLFESPKNITLW